MTAKRKSRRRESTSERPGAVVDTVDHKRAEQALLVSEERLRAVLATTADAIFIVDRRGVIQSVSAAAERIFGYSAADLLGQNLTMTVPSPERNTGDAWVERLSPAAGGGETQGRQIGRAHV